MKLLQKDCIVCSYYYMNITEIQKNLIIKINTVDFLNRFLFISRMMFKLKYTKLDTNLKGPGSLKMTIFVE